MHSEQNWFQKTASSMLKRRGNKDPNSGAFLELLFFIVQHYYSQGTRPAKLQKYFFVITWWALEFSSY